MIEILSFDFAQNAIIASLLLSVCVGIIGTLVVINKMSFVASGIAHGFLRAFRLILGLWVLG